jgi:ribosomal protein L16 Arg81 hydroxylase
MVIFHSFLYVLPEGNWFSPPTKCSYRAAPRLAQDASRLAKGSGVPEHWDPLHEFLLQTGGPAWDHGEDQPTNQATKQLVKAKPAQKLEILKTVFS